MAILGALNDIKQGLIISYNNEPWQVMEANFMRTSQRKPVMQTKLKSLLSDKTLEISFKPGDKVEEANIEKKKAQYLYADATEANFMDQKTYEQFSVKKNLIDEKLTYLKEGQEVDIVLWQDSPLTIAIPKKVELKVIEAPPGVKGDSAQGRVTKQITLENGLQMSAPLFIKEGDIVRINTDSGEYVERVT
jgi:elongation factor P